MTSQLRWRILSLQIIVTILFAFLAGVAYWGHGFVQDQVSSQLSQQNIVFPTDNSPAIKALPASDAVAMRQYAGQTMTNGDQAHVYANNFIAVHLKEIGSGKTYSYFSGKALAEQATNPKQFAIDNGIALTLFRGETLRSMLLNAWAFWFAATLVLFAALGLTIGAIAVFFAFLYEFLMEPKREGVLDLKPRKATGAAVPVP